MLETALPRLLQLALRLGSGQTVTSGYIRQVYKVSPATAKRDLRRLENALQLIVEETAGRQLHRQKVLRLAPGINFTPLLRAPAS